jgi:hypothetical protein
MKNLLLAIVVVALVCGLGNTASAGNMMLSVGADVLLPMGTFGDAFSTGFGGSVRGQYDVNAMFSAGLTIGYYTWSGKDITIGGTTSSGPTFSGLPIRVFGKYYFMPAGAARVYGIAELGLFFGSVGDQTIPNPAAGFPGQPANITVSGGSSSDFNYAPGVGLELPLGSGNTKLDVSVRYDGVATSGSSSGSLGARVGINFGLGN